MWVTTEAIVILMMMYLLQQKLDLETCPKPLVFILHTFLSAKIARLGLIA